ncbi:MAG: hypothetical protein IKT40_06120 [Bacilli bacterium]|nr:hypothetical protein [Bacilli bacterium]
MASTTTNYKLNVLTYTDAIDIKPISDNFTTIDTIHKALADRVTAIEGMNLGLTTYMGFAELGSSFSVNSSPGAIILEMEDSSILYGVVDSNAGNFYPSTGQVIYYKWAEQLIDITFISSDGVYSIINITPSNYVELVTAETTFSISGGNNTYTFRQGMTWAEFIASDYNAGSFTIDEQNQVRWSGVVLTYPNTSATPCKPSDMILATSYNA